MQVLLKFAARIAAVIGVVTMVIAVLGRAAGLYWFGGLQIGTVLQAGMAATLVACLAYLALLVEAKAP